MQATTLSAGRLRATRLICISFALPSFLLGGWLLLEPGAFWRLVGVEGGLLVQGLYTGAIFGEGAMFALGAKSPARYLVFFQYLLVYKTMACVAGTATLLQLDAAPTGAWLVIAAWAVPGVIAAAIFPWGQWPQLAQSISRETSLGG